MDTTTDTPAKSAPHINPVVTEIVRNGLVAVTEEMKINLMRTSDVTTPTTINDANGNLSGLDVDCCGNTYPMPESPSLVEPPYHVHGVLAHHAQQSAAADAASRRG